MTDRINDRKDKDTNKNEVSIETRQERFIKPYIMLFIVTNERLIHECK